MSAIIELRSPSNRINNQVLKLVKESGFDVVGDSANYLAVRYKKDVYQVSDGNVPEFLIDTLTQNKKLLPPNKPLEKYKSAIGRVAVAFYGEDTAEHGLATMHPILKYQGKKQEKKKK